MNNYKIRVNNEAESKEAQELFFELGYAWRHGKSYLKISSGFTHLTAYSDGSLSMGFGDAEKELTLPQLRDLVVLHRNDIDDANWETEGGDQIYEDSSGKSFIFRKQGWDELQRHEMRQAMWEKNKSKPQTTENEQGLISGADAKPVENSKKFITADHLNRFQAAQAHLQGEPVQFMTANGDFIDITDNSTLGIFATDGGYSFRLKPRNVKLEIEVPAPFEPKDGELFWHISPEHEKGYAKSMYDDRNVNTWQQFGAWRTEAEIKIVVEQLRKLKELSQ